MAVDTFRELVLEQLVGLKALRCKRMFGGFGLYSGEHFFGIVFDARLYFKTNPVTLPEYLQYHSAVFAPSERQVLKNYREVPLEILEDRERLLLWAQRAAR